MVLAIGFLAQALFSARILFQWIMSERARKVVSPSIYWILSILGSYLLFIYGWLRDDFAIILGQLIAYYIYIWNLDEKGIWSRLPLLLRIVMISTPVAAMTWLLSEPGDFVETFFSNDSIPLWMIVFGSAGQILFTLRFVYQWYYSYRRHESILPTGFWVISLAGSATIVFYGILRKDPVLIIGQSVGFVAYMRNIMLQVREKKRSATNAGKPHTRI